MVVVRLAIAPSTGTRNSGRSIQPGVPAIISGGWSAVWSWRHRAGRAHVLSLLLVLWGIVLAAMTILPRTGYTGPNLPAATWNCS